jgi:hypothetical protein
MNPSKRTDQEITVLNLTFLEAHRRAQQGEVDSGYELLREGLRRAEHDRDRGERWGDELVGRYEDALHKYSNRYGIARAA